MMRVTNVCAYTNPGGSLQVRVGQSSLYDACASGEVELVNQLLSAKDKGRPMDLSRGAEDVELLGYTPLMAAAFHDKPDQARMICEVKRTSICSNSVQPSLFFFLLSICPPFRSD